MELIKNLNKNFKIIIRDIEIISNKNITIIAGPCAIENEKYLFEIAKFLKKCGIKILRGGAFKPRTSPYDFQGLGIDGLKLLKDIACEFNFITVTEILDPRDIEYICEYCDILQIGTRNMFNYSLLKEVGKAKKPVILKRGWCATIKEFLLAAEYIAIEGNYNIILCERGIRTFESETRNTLDLSSIPVIKSYTNLPIIVDPSHGTGKREYVIPMSMASIAAGADGIMIEIHPNPEKALSDGKQSLKFEDFKKLLEKIYKISNVLNKEIKK